MSKKSRTLKKAAAQLCDRRAVTKVKDPGDVIAVIPYLVGFTPTESLVVIALEGPRRRFGPCVRLDLAETEDDVEQLLDYLVEVIRRHGFRTLLVAAFSSRPKLADPVMRTLLARLERRGVTVTEALRADGERWWSYQCLDPACCSAAGTPYDSASTRVAAEAVLAGMSKAEDRDALRQQFAPAPEKLRSELGSELLRVETETAAGRLPRWDEAALVQAVRSALHNPRLSVSTQAQLVLSVQDVSMRDVAWMMVRRANAKEHFQLWRQLMVLAPAELMAPVGGLAAFAAWVAGSGVLASHAADRVEEVSPGYPMARLLRQALEQCVNPKAWDEAPGRPRLS